MPDTADSPEDKAHAASIAIAEQAGHLWMLANAQGMRQGMAVTAEMVDGTITALSGDPSLDAGQRRLCSSVLTSLREQITLAALQIEDPEPRP
jgi:hypothetical protein